MNVETKIKIADTVSDALLCIAVLVTAFIVLVGGL